MLDKAVVEDEKWHRARVGRPACVWHIQHSRHRAPFAPSPVREVREAMLGSFLGCRLTHLWKRLSHCCSTAVISDHFTGFDTCWRLSSGSLQHSNVWSYWQRRRAVVAAHRPCPVKTTSLPKMSLVPGGKTLSATKNTPSFTTNSICLQLG